jgi:ribokinase
VSRVSVVGSLHLDILVEAPRLPATDETLAGRAWSRKCGGKGGNQAVAAARFGASTAMGGRIGNDDFGRTLLTNLQAAGVDVSCIETDDTASSGMSVAIQEVSGEYGAVIVSGANLAVDASAIEHKWAPLWRADVLMLQNEVPDAVNLAAAKAARAAGCRVMLNAAPAKALASALAELVDILVVNRVEAGQMSGQPIGRPEDVARAAAALYRAGQYLVITMGGDGLHLTMPDGTSSSQRAFAVNARSAHGAGDCFCGALAARLALGDDLATACEFAQAAAALFVAAAPDEQAALSADRIHAFQQHAERSA